MTFDLKAKFMQALLPRWSLAVLWILAFLIWPGIGVLLEGPATTVFLPLFLPFGISLLVCRPTSVGACHMGIGFITFLLMMSLHVAFLKSRSAWSLALLTLILITCANGCSIMPSYGGLGALWMPGYKGPF